MANLPHRSLNISYSKILPIIPSKVRIREGFNPAMLVPPVPTSEYNAIWDTGATQTAITAKVVKECALKPSGMCTIQTAGGERKVPTYFVSVYLPNNVCLPQLRVTEAELAGSIEVLIGMDVINFGDFAITNHNGKTNMSFRMPSIECIDFVKQQKASRKGGAKILNKVGRNDPCPCGSGKKYKKCCG